MKNPISFMKIKEPIDAQIKAIFSKVKKDKPTRVELIDSLGYALKDAQIQADDMGLMVSIQFTSKCQCCDESYDVDLDIDDIDKFTSEMSYCGKNQYCCP